MRKIKLKIEFLPQKISSFASRFKLAIILGQQAIPKIATRGSEASIFSQIPNDSVHACVCVCMHAYVCMHMYICLYMCVCVCMCVYVCVCDIVRTHGIR
jgi:hypothetical protein